MTGEMVKYDALRGQLKQVGRRPRATPPHRGPLPALTPGPPPSCASSTPALPPTFAGSTPRWSRTGGPLRPIFRAVCASDWTTLFETLPPAFGAATVEVTGRRGPRPICSVRAAQRARSRSSRCRSCGLARWSRPTPRWRPTRRSCGTCARCWASTRACPPTRPLGTRPRRPSRTLGGSTRRCWREACRRGLQCTMQRRQPRARPRAGLAGAGRRTARGGTCLCGPPITRLPFSCSASAWQLCHCPCGHCAALAVYL